MFLWTFNIITYNTLTSFAFKYHYSFGISQKKNRNILELKILFKNTSYLIITKVVKFIVGIIRAKLVAIYLGTLGAGVIAQLLQITESISQFTLLSMNDGLVKQIAESDRN